MSDKEQLKKLGEELVDHPMAHLFIYHLPQWLLKEFELSEILLYQHHFSLTDKDGGGDVDAEELQFLLEQFGSRVTLEEAQEILEEYDLDGGGTVDFIEFMVLVFKIQKGTIQIKNNKLASAIVAVKSQLNLFAEICDIQQNIPDNCKVINFGGAVVTGEFLIYGHEGLIIYFILSPSKHSS